MSFPKSLKIPLLSLKLLTLSFKKISIKKTLFSWKKNEKEIFEAVRGISFQIEKGQIVGIVGKNGSGKSTLLRALAGIYSPDEGSIDTHGYSISLLALGVGFNKKLSGRENIVLSGMLLGFSEETVQSKIRQIIKFADLGEFIDKPVSTYSSGMYSKLAFSINSILETEIMLIDEVMSVGDAKFRKKSKAKLESLINDENKTVVIVSHNLIPLREMCHSVIWLHDGKIMMQGDTQEVLDAYEKFME